MEAPTPARSYTLEQLATFAGLPRRTVRYYIQLGLVDRPIGETRAAHYTPHHLDQLLTVQKYTSAGLSLERIGLLLQQTTPVLPVALPRTGTVDVRSHLTLADGVELVVEPGRAGLSPEQVRRLFQETLRLYRNLLQETNDER
jgi:DNA-binding transcriptional MerR regulator